METETLISLALCGSFALGVFLLGMWDLRRGGHAKGERDR